MTRYVLGDVRRNFADNINHVIDKKVRQIEVESIDESLKTHVDLMVRAMNKLNIRVNGFNPRDSESVKWFFKKCNQQIQADGGMIKIEHRIYGPRVGGPKEDQIKSGFYFFRQYQENVPPEIAYWISDPIFSSRPGLLYNGQGTKIGKPRWFILTNVPGDDGKRMFN